MVLLRVELLLQILPHLFEKIHCNTFALRSSLLVAFCQETRHIYGRVLAPCMHTVAYVLVLLLFCCLCGEHTWNILIFNLSQNGPQKNKPIRHKKIGPTPLPPGWDGSVYEGWRGKHIHQRAKQYNMPPKETN